MFIINMMSILPFLLLLVGVVQGRAIDEDRDLDVLQPIISRSMQRRICAELCMSGLGGAKACGVDCVDLVPSNLPLEYVSDNSSSSEVGHHARVTRYGACDVLCQNNLGYPLCQCDDNSQDANKETNFFQVCSAFCNKYNYQIYGCQKCSLYNTTDKGTNGKFAPQSLFISGSNDIDWDAWCSNKCQIGDGGAACNCDLLPMSLNIDDDSATV